MFQKCIAQRLEGLEGVVNIVDDILVSGEDEKQHDRRQSADGQDQKHQPEVKQRQM